MSQTIQRIYKNGKIELAETPQGITESQVLVTFLNLPSPKTSKHTMVFEMFSGIQQSTEANFKEAEFHGDADDALNWE